MSRYSKMVVALIGAVGTWAATYFPDSHNVQMAVGLASALVTVATVYLVPNTPPAGQPSDPKISEQGATLIATLILITALILVGVGCFLLIIAAVVSHTLSATGLILLIIGIIVGVVGRAFDGGGRPLL